MPIYEYECKACGHRLEKIQKFSDEPLKDCPACAKPELSKLVSAAAFRLKGGGWYETDFKSGGKKNVLHGGSEGGGGDGGGSESGSAASGGAGAESKPADAAKGGTTGGDTSTSKSDSGKKGDASAAAT
ncbi:MAG: FmdB family zinc ribbon protein [Pseudomonadota bacterium]